MQPFGYNRPYGDSYYKDYWPDDDPWVDPPEAPEVDVGISYGEMVSFTLAILPSQGVGFSENSGAWPFPYAGCAGVDVMDGNNNLRNLVFDSRDGLPYDIATRNGPENGGLVKRWWDKMLPDGTGGRPILPKVRFGEDVGTFENYWLRHGVSHVFIRPADTAHRGMEGFSPIGLPPDIRFLLRLFVDGERQVAERTVQNIPITGDIHTDEQVEGNRIALVLSATEGCHVVAGRKQEYVVTDRPLGSSVMTEDDYQEDIAKLLYWLSREPFGVDRVTGTPLSTSDLSGLTSCPGPDGRDDSAIEITNPFTTWAMGAGTSQSKWFSLWALGGILATDEEQGSPVTLYQVGAIGEWVLWRGILSPGENALRITPSSSLAHIFDLRIYSAVIHQWALDYYFNNIEQHEGDAVLP